MIKSMTGYGHVVHDDGQYKVNVEVKTLNSKFLDASIRLPKALTDKEIEVRNLLNEKLERGKVSLMIDIQLYGAGEVRQTYNETLFLAYYAGLKKLADRVLAPYDQLFELALNSPDVIQSTAEEGTPDELWIAVRNVLLEAIRQCEAFRTDEGKTLMAKFIQYIHSIENSLRDIEALDETRILRMREKLKSNIVDFFGESGYDVNRLEQEIIYYIEKFDIHEERVRLQTHLDYFIQALKEPQSNGKKLGFIAQEIGREINTIGSKANDASIQKLVVLMKEELEKIKEQLGNVL
ncbi:MAG: YicC family protein [Cyclobacteriaceae bacterium]|nr:YicC family protein [Cyclobacteriaceae bacterium]